MKGLSRFLLFFAFFAVLVLGGRTLIQGPDDETPDCETPVPAQTAIACSEAEPLLPELPVETKVHASRAEKTEQPGIPMILTDRNGQPIASRAWSRTMYQSCAPEGIPG